MSAVIQTTNGRKNLNDICWEFFARGVEKDFYKSFTGLMKSFPLQPVV
jgi:hypothetical protein